MNLTARVGDIARAGKTDPLKKIEAGRMALRILDLDDQLDQIYQERDMYRKNGQLPDKRPYGEPCIDFKQMPVKLANHQKYVRDYKAKLAKSPGNTNLAHQLQKHEWFVSHYKKELNLK
jgi:flagellar biosynthesis chaperone FliJ